MKPFSRAEVLRDIVPLDKWFLINAKQTGFFRVNYDVHNWQLIVNQLNVDYAAFDEITRIQLIDDAFVLSDGGHINMSLVLDLISFVKEDPSLLVLKKAIEHLPPFLKAFKGNGLFGAMKTHLVDILSNHYHSITLDNWSYDVGIIRETKITLIEVICPIYEPCIEEARRRFEIWMNDPTNFRWADESIQETIICTVISEGSEKEWNRVWKALIEVETLKIIKDELLRALACSRHRWILDRYLWLVSSNVRTFMSGKLGLVFKAIASNPIGSDIIWEYLLHLLPPKNEPMSTQMISLMFEVIPQFTSEMHYKQLKMLIDDQRAIHEDTYLLEGPLSYLRTKLDFLSRTQEALYLWTIQKEKELVLLSVL